MGVATDRVANVGNSPTGNDTLSVTTGIQCCSALNSSKANAKYATLTFSTKGEGLDPTLRAGSGQVRRRLGPLCFSVDIGSKRPR